MTISACRRQPEAGLGDIARLPFSLKVLLENLLRFEDGRSVSVDDIHAVAGWLDEGRGTGEIAYRPARVLMQDFTGVPAVVDPRSDARRRDRPRRRRRPASIRSRRSIS